MSTVPAGVQVQGTHLIRASINPSGRPQGRVLTQQGSGSNVVTASVAGGGNSANNSSSLQVSQAGVVQSPQISQQQTGGPGGQILATVQCPRPQTATLVYSNVGNHTQGQSPFGTVPTTGGQRLTLSQSRPIRPIQLTATNNRITGTGLRTANISIRPPSNVPGLTGTNVLTATIPGQGMNQQQQNNQGMGQQQRTGPGGGLSGIVGATGNTGTANLATRIIQVQAPQSGGGGTAQVINTGRISGNLMTLTPVLSQVNTGGGGGGRGSNSGGQGPQLTAGKVQPSLTITHVGKITQQGQGHNQQQQQSQQMGQGGHIVVSQAPQQQQQMQPQTMIVTMGSQGGMVGGPMTTTATTIVGQGGQQQHHHQVMNVVSQATAINNNSGGNNNNPSVSGTTTMLPLSGITTTVGRPGGATGIVRTLTTSQAGGGLQGNMSSSSSATTLMPLSKGSNPGQTIVETQLQQAQQAGSIFIHSGRAPNPVNGEWEQ